MNSKRIGSSVWKLLVEQHQLAGDLAARLVIAVARLDAEDVAQHLEQRQIRNRLAVRRAVGLVHADTARAAALDEFEAEPALAGAGVGHDAHHLPVAGDRRFERSIEARHLALAADELREAARPRRIESRAQRADALQFVDAQRHGDALQIEVAEIAESEVALDQARGVRRHVAAVGRGQLLHALCESDRVSLRRVVHAQVIADLADHHLARVDPDARREAQALRAPKLVRVRAQRIAQVQRRVAGALRMILVRDRRAEQRHDAVTGVLVDGALEAVDAFGEDLEEALEDAVPLLGVELPGQFHRALHVREQHRDLLALAFERGLRLQDLVREMLGCVGAGASREIARRSRRRHRPRWRPRE
ncbi:MAG: hypothetical protein NTZ61_09035, partial [Proteobacteria bacterium]|nr:hypothetical protein [Pseudomonadota bacterium]